MTVEEFILDRASVYTVILDETRAKRIDRLTTIISRAKSFTSIRSLQSVFNNNIILVTKEDNRVDIIINTDTLDTW